MLKKLFYGVYGLGGYIVGAGAIAYLIGFIADFGAPKTIATGGSDGGIIISALVDTLLVLAFGAHHSATARASFKRWWTRIVPAPIERATYLYMTAAMTAALVGFWRPIPIVIWSIEPPVAQAIIYVAYAGVWAMMLAATFHFGHFSFMGLTQVWRRIVDAPARNDAMTARFLYALVRHPISLGWMIAPWLTPTLTVGHAVFAAATTAYIFSATPFEEADLAADIGEDYATYKKRVPAFFPRLRR
ncbi:MAG: isoprenylcysteine carboxylmethyltransferase family protein [Pseudomonadota bacterium]